MGTKAKFWYLRGTEKWLFKRCRPDTGEDWAEKLGADAEAVAGLVVVSTLLSIGALPLLLALLL